MTLSDARTTTVWAYPAGTTEGIPLNPGGSSVTYTHFTSLMEGLSSLCQAMPGNHALHAIFIRGTDASLTQETFTQYMHEPSPPHLILMLRPRGL